MNEFGNATDARPFSPPFDVAETGYAKATNAQREVWVNGQKHPEIAQRSKHEIDEVLVAAQIAGAVILSEEVDE